MTLKDVFGEGMVGKFGSAGGTRWWQVQWFRSVCCISSWWTTSARRVSQRSSSALRHKHRYV